MSDRDRSAVKELRENLELYMFNDPYLRDQLQRVYSRRKRELNEVKKQQLMVKELLESKISTRTMEEANVSMSELKEIRLLVAFDKDIFAPESDIHHPNFLLEDNPYSFFVNFDRLPEITDKKIKQLLYRPERMARLQKAYHRLAVCLENNWQKRVNEKREFQRNKAKRLDWHDRQPVKTKEEYELMDSLCKKIDQQMVIKGEDNMREIADRLTDPKAPLAEHTDVRDWYKPLLATLIEERRKLPKADRLK